MSCVPEEPDVCYWIGVDTVDVRTIVYDARWYPHGECPREAAQAALYGGCLGLWSHAPTSDVKPRIDLIDVLAN
eukprot:5000934-Pyramimonas_sp.AAC.1